MTYLLIAVIIVLILSHFAPDLSRMRRYDWFVSWIDFLGARVSHEAWRSPYALLLGIGLPALAVAIVQAALSEPLNGVFGFLFAIAGLFYAWGPRDLDRDVQLAADSPPVDQPEQAAARLQGPRPETGAAMAALVGRAAQRRWFGPLLWFIVLGTFGAVLYRLAQLAAEDGIESLPEAQQIAARRLLAILDWPVAHLMALGMAIATDFDAVARIWRGRARSAGTWFAFDPALVAATTAAAVKADLESEDATSADDFDDGLMDDRGVVLRDALAVVWRVLIVWLAFMALAALVSLLT